MNAGAPVPQHLELDDVVAWGLGATDLLCVMAGGGAAWWIASSIDGALPIRLALGAPACIAGIALGVVRVSDRRLRTWLGLIVAYCARRRVLAVGGSPCV